jgi:hypothetical protein
MRRVAKLDLVVGILLGLVVGLVVTYLLVVVLVGGNQDTSTISTSPRGPAGEAKKGSREQSYSAPSSQRP